MASASRACVDEYPPLSTGVLEVLREQHPVSLEPDDFQRWKNAVVADSASALPVAAPRLTRQHARLVRQHALSHLLHEAHAGILLLQHAL